MVYFRYRLLPFFIAALFAFFPFSAVAAEVIRHPSGATLILEPMPEKQVTSVQLWVKTGSINEGERFHGLSHFLEHLLFKGSLNYPLGTIDRTIEGFGGRVNAATSKDFTYYYISSANQFAPLALDILGDIVLNPIFDTDEMVLEKEVVIEEIRRGLDNPYRQVYETLAAMLFENHPYQRNVIAHEAAITNSTRELIAEYHRRYYSPANLAIVAVGGFDRERLLEQIELVLAPHTVRGFQPSAPRHYPALPSLAREQYQQLSDEKVQVKSLVWASRGPIGAHRDTYALDLLSELLSAGKQSLWYREFVEPGTLLSAWASFSTNLSHGAFYMAARYQPEQTYHDVMSNLNHSLEKLSADLLAGNLDDHIARAKQRITNAKIFQQQKVDAIATRLGIAFTVTGLEYDQTYVENLATVTAPEIARVLKTYVLRPAGAGVELVPKKP
ncbi:M16 family metallopeptidase [Chrysiogenes arsenatis]|uniref:M16 family metallopeptidase n=1 Tax=Chrysiogenes arsenatis TaxID=309797 RepID=UPI0003F51074|nr:pitrilysin family protein [Chrysiogenes arsenatis]